MTEEEKINYLDMFVEMGYGWAIEFRISNLQEWGTTEELHNFIEHWAAQGNPDAVKQKAQDLISGWYGYPRDLVAAREFIEGLVAQGNPEAIKLKAQGLANGFYGYAQNPEAARNFINQLAEQGNENAMKEVTSLLRPDEAHTFIEHFANQGNDGAIKLKATGLTHNVYGYQRSPEAAHRFIEQQVEAYNPAAIELKAEGLLFGRYGYNVASAAEMDDFIARYVADPIARDHILK
jgi:TPR repeat protein